MLTLQGALCREFRLILDFVKLNATTSGLEGWPIPNIQQALSRLGTLKSTVFTAGYHQTKLAKASRAFIWTPQAIAVFEYCQQAILNCQKLYFLEDMATPILQTDASDYGIGGYLFMVTNGKAVRCDSSVRPSSDRSVREKECYGVRLFEDLFDNRPFMLNTDHMNLKYLNVTLTGKVLRWKFYLHDK